MVNIPPRSAERSLALSWVVPFVGITLLNPALRRGVDLRRSRRRSRRSWDSMRLCCWRMIFSSRLMSASVAAEAVPGTNKTAATAIATALTAVVICDPRKSRACAACHPRRMRTNPITCYPPDHNPTRAKSTSTNGRFPARR